MALSQRATGHKTMTVRTSVGQGVQHIGLGFVQAPQRTRTERPSPLRWLGRRMERLGKRLQREDIEDPGSDGNFPNPG